jgi:hypothetical protein
MDRVVCAGVDPGGGDGPVFVNQIIYVEISVGFATVEECEWAVEAQG